MDVGKQEYEDTLMKMMFNCQALSSPFTHDSFIWLLNHLNMKCNICPGLDFFITSRLKEKNDSHEFESNDSLTFELFVKRVYVSTEAGNHAELLRFLDWR